MPRRSLVALFALLGCSTEPTDQQAPATERASASEPANAEAGAEAAGEAAKPEAAKPETAKPEPATPEPATPTPTPVVELPPGSPRAVAVREGPIELRGGQIVIDGEPLLVDAQGRVSRDIALGQGLEPMQFDSSVGSTRAFVGDPKGLAFVTTSLDFNRAASEYKVYERKDGRWKRLDLERGLLVEYYPALFERGGAVFGLRAYAGNPKDEDAVYDGGDENPEHTAKLDKAYAKAKRGFAQLAGPSVEAPVLPADVWVADSVAATRDGTLYAVTIPKPRVSFDEPEDESWTPGVLVWAPTSSAAKRLALPDYVVPSEGEDPKFSLAVAGDHALIGGLSEGMQPYLVVAQGETFERVSEGLAPNQREANAVVSATRAPSGAIWAVLGDFNPWAEFEPEHRLWTRDPATKTWSRVELPKLTDPRFVAPRTRWLYSSMEERWVSVELLANSEGPPVAEQVAWIAGGLWIVADLGDVRDRDGEGLMMMSELERKALYTSLTGSERDPLVELPSFDQLVFDHGVSQVQPNAKPGSKDCEHAWFVFDLPVPSGPELATLDETAFGLSRAQLDALGEIEGIELTDSYGASSPEQLYVGEREGKRELVLLVSVREASHAAKLEAAVEAATGLRPKLECRPRSLVHMIIDFLG